MSSSSTSINDKVPIIDLGKAADDDDEGAAMIVINQIADACQKYGFFQIINHGIDAGLIDDFRHVSNTYFTTYDDRNNQRRSANNSRGYFDNELTKQKRDWKLALDMGMPGGSTRNWGLDDNDPASLCLDGYNQLPTQQQLPNFRTTVIKYFKACSELSHKLAIYMAAGVLKCDTCQEAEQSQIVQDLRQKHTSYLRLNYYPICNDVEIDEKKDEQHPLGISPHKDAGFLTVLLPDENCHSLQVYYENDWHTVIPCPNAITINTGDMAQIWSNGLYQAPLHRVLTHPTSTRFSAPFFYNPGYETYVTPHVVTTMTTIDDQQEEKEKKNADAALAAKYHPCLWGYFRAVRFAGDLTNLGVEIQIDDYEITTDNKQNKHLEKQKIFAETARFDEPFSVERYRDLLQS